MDEARQQHKQQNRLEDTEGSNPNFIYAVF